MLEKNTLIKVTNKSNGGVGYTIQDLGNLRRTFVGGETKEVTMEELRKLSFIPGGMSLLKNYLIIHNDDAVAEILGDVEPEYYYTEKEVKDLLENQSLDALKDCLDFAPEGTINLVKKVAVETELNDIKKREAILKATNFNVDSAILVNRETMDETEEDKGTKKRRVDTKPEVKEDTTQPTRRVAVSPTKPKYNVVSIKE